MNTIVYEIIICFFQSVISGVFFLNLLEEKYSKRLVFLLWCELMTGISVITNSRNTVIRFVLLAITSILFIILCFEDKNQKKVAVYLSESGVNLISAVISFLMHNIISENKYSFIDSVSSLNYTFRLLYLILFSFLISVIFQFIRKVRGIELSWILGTQVIIGLGECAAVLAVASFHSGEIEAKDSIIILIATGCMVIANLSIGILAPYFIKQVSMAKNIDYGNELSGMEYKYYEISVENDKKIREMRHDISNQIQTIYSLIKNGEKEESLNLINELKDRYSKVERLVYCENSVVNVILLNKKVEAEKQGIETHITIKESLKDLPIADFDLSTVICNLVDNAIRGCLCSEQSHPRLIIEILYKNNYLVIRVLNSCKVGMIVESTDRIETTKSNSQTHGFGMPIVSSVTKRYKGDFIVSAQNGIFTATAVLSIK